MVIEYVADFETTSIKVYGQKTVKGKTIKFLDNKKSESFVCAWGLAPVGIKTTENIITGRTLKQFLDTVENIASNLKSKDKLSVFTHNLKFDGAFILYYCLFNKYGEIFDEVRDTQLYNFSLRYPSGIEVTFRDSSKIFTCSVDKLGKNYGIKKLKGFWDYEKYRDENTEISDDEWEYVKHDVFIVCKALEDYRAKGFTQNTAAAIAYNQRLSFTYPNFNKKSVSRFREKAYHKYRKLFPFDIMPLQQEVHEELISAYFGGWTWLNPHYADMLLYNVTSFDENSMYPDKMANAILPVGQPKIYEKPTQKTIEKVEKLYDCIIYKISNLTLELKDEWSLPMLMFDTDYKTSVRCQGKVITCNNEMCWLTNHDVMMMRNEYEIKSMKIEKLFCFVGKRGQYRKFVKHWMKVKEEHTILANEAKLSGDYESFAIHEQMRNIAKLMLNSSYGKDGTKLLRAKKTSYIEDGLLETYNDIETTVIEYYLPSAIFICSSARYNLYEALKVAGKSFIYSDTDSLKVLDEGKEAIYKAAEQGLLVIDDSALGAWKNEAFYEQAKFVRQKTYATFEKGKWTYTACGAPESVKSVFKIEDFKRGMVITLNDIHEHIDEETGKPLQGKLVPISVTGGVILMECPFQIANHEDWGQFTPDNLPIHLFVKFMKELKEVNSNGC